jgi:hypothetical protein
MPALLQLRQRFTPLPPRPRRGRMHSWVTSLRTIGTPRKAMSRYFWDASSDSQRDSQTPAWSPAVDSLKQRFWVNHKPVTAVFYETNQNMRLRVRNPRGITLFAHRNNPLLHVTPAVQCSDLQHNWKFVRNCVSRKVEWNIHETSSWSPSYFSQPRNFSSGLRVEPSEVNSLKQPREIKGIAIRISRVYRNRIGDKWLKKKWAQLWNGKGAKPAKSRRVSSKRLSEH